MRQKCPFCENEAFSGVQRSFWGAKFPLFLRSGLQILGVLGVALDWSPVATAQGHCVLSLAESWSSVSLQDTTGPPAIPSIPSMHIPGCRGHCHDPKHAPRATRAPSPSPAPSFRARNGQKSHDQGYINIPSCLWGFIPFICHGFGYFSKGNLVLTWSVRPIPPSPPPQFFWMLQTGLF